MAKLITQQNYTRINRRLNEIGGEQQSGFDRKIIKSILDEVNSQTDLKKAGMILYFRTVKEHPFRGANRRTAEVATEMVMNINGVEFKPLPLDRTRALNQRIRDGRVSKEEFEKLYKERFINRKKAYA